MPTPLWCTSGSRSRKRKRRLRPRQRRRLSRRLLAPRRRRLPLKKRKPRNSFSLLAMKVIVGLGNPGSRYEGTRHNVGYAVIDLLAQSPRAGKEQARFQAEVVELAEDSGKILLVKPETFMNLSGRSVRQVLDFYQLPLQ